MFLQVWTYYYILYFKHKNHVRNKNIAVKEYDVK